jgi:hypothetical protein
MDDDERELHNRRMEKEKRRRRTAWLWINKPWQPRRRLNESVVSYIEERMADGTINLVDVVNVQ